MAVTNLAVRFLTELTGVAALGYAAFQIAAAPVPVRIAAGIGAALALVVAWGLVVAPSASSGLTQPQKDLVGSGLLLLAALALGLAGQARLAVAFAILVVANTALLFVFGQGAREALTGLGR